MSTETRENWFKHLRKRQVLNPYIQRMVNDNLASEFLICCLLAILFCSYLIWIRTMTITAVFFLCFLVLCFAKITLGKIGYAAFFPRLFSKSSFIAAVSLVTFCIAYIASDIRPGVTKGWFGWWDQSQYLLMAQDLSSLRLVADHYFYGLGYPLIGVLFYKIYPTNPFLIPNLLLYVVTIILYFKISREYLSEGLSVLTVLLIMWGTQLTEFFVVPWNNSVSIFGIGILIYLATVVREIRLVHAISIGIVLGWVFSARYVDIIFLLPIVIYIYLREMSKSWKNIKYLLISICICFIIFCGVFYSHKYAFGSFLKTPYHLHIQPLSGHSDQSLAAFSLSRIPDHLYSIIINPYQFHYLKYWRLNTPLLGYSFFFILALAGFSYSMFYKRAWVIGVTFLSMIASFAFYGSFTSTRASDLKYHCLRYFAMWYPILSLMAVLALSKLARYGHLLRRERRMLIFGVVAMLLFVGLSYSYLQVSSYRLKNKMIDSSQWKVSSNYNNESSQYAIDKNPVTRWDTGVPQRPGMYFLVDLGLIEKVGLIRLTLYGSTNDYPRGLKVQVSTDGVAWHDGLSLKGLSPPHLTDDNLELHLPAVRVRYIKLVQTGSNNTYFWSIHEFEIYRT